MKNMKGEANGTIKLSETDKVNAYMRQLEHPLVKVVEAIRQIILKTHKKSGKK